MFLPGIFYKQVLLWIGNDHCFYFDLSQELKAEVEPKQVDIESLNQKGQDLAKDAQPADQVVVKEPLSSVNRRWDNLLEGIGERQVTRRKHTLYI